MIGKSGVIEASPGINNKRLEMNKAGKCLLC